MFMILSQSRRYRRRRRSQAPSHGRHSGTLLKSYSFCIDSGFDQHIFYEITGTAGAFSSSSAISRFGNNYSFFLTPGVDSDLIFMFTFFDIL